MARRLALFQHGGKEREKQRVTIVFARKVGTGKSYKGFGIVDSNYKLKWGCGGIGRRNGLKIRCKVTCVRVQVPPSPLFY